MNDEDLRAKLALLRDGDKTAFEEIYTALKIPLFTLICRITRDRGMAEDVMQEVFVKLYEQPPEGMIRKPRAYLFQSARNLALDTVRKRRQDMSLTDCESGNPDHAGHSCLRLDLERALDALPLEERQIVTLHLNGGLKFREIADMLEIPLGTALWKYQKALGRLRTALE